MKVGLFLIPVVIFASVQKLLQEESPGSQPFTQSHTLRIPLCSRTHSYVTPTPDVTDKQTFANRNDLQVHHSFVVWWSRAQRNETLIPSQGG